MTSPHLLVIDLQRIFAEPTSAWACPDFAGVLAPTRALASALAAMPPASAAGNVTFTRFVAPQRPEGAWVDYYAAWPFALLPADDPLYDVVDDVADLARAAGPSVDATTFGKWGSGLAARTAHAGELLVAGVSTDCCVLSSVLAAADAGRRVRVVADACAGADAASHERALAVMALYAPLVEVTTCDQVLGELAAAR